MGKGRKYIQRFEVNEQGRDFAVGDIHGCYAKLRAKLKDISFDPTVDRLFGVGDLVDRGPESHEVLAWLKLPWFKSVKGNHEEMLISYLQVPPHHWGKHGVEWFYDITHAERKRYTDEFLKLPVLIEVQTKQGKVGIVHAECVRSSWAELVGEFEAARGKGLRRIVSASLWARSRWLEQRVDDVLDVRAVVVGHSRVETPSVLGNVHYIDTCGGQTSRELTIIDLETLEKY